MIIQFVLQNYFSIADFVFTQYDMTYEIKKSGKAGMEAILR